MISHTIRTEKAGDEAAIHALTERAFAPMPFSAGEEQHVVDRLRADRELTLSLVAEDGDGVIIGHIAFSPVTISDGARDWFGLGPVCAAPDLQKQGIGSALIREGIARMEKAGAKGIVLLGSNEYYPRFGFEHDPALKYPGPPPEFFQRRILSGDPPSGTVRYAKGFGEG